MDNATQNYAVITTIFPPGKAVDVFSKMQEWKTIIIGDKKTPEDWSYPGIQYFSPQTQQKYPFHILKHLPWNHYSRKMIGYLFALRSGATLIMDTDDDTIPYGQWNFPDFAGRYDSTSENEGFINPYLYFTNQNIWPRGFPLDMILGAQQKIKKISISKKISHVGIWQALVNDDPDVDAIYRLTINQSCVFHKREPIVLGVGTVAPFNSQNTLWSKELFPLLYLPATVSFRFTDILRSIVAQPILWAKSISLGFLQPNSFQKRNAHVYIDDFNSEIPMYLQTKMCYEITKNSVKKELSINENLLAVYYELFKQNIVEKTELKLLDAWIYDMENIGK